MSGFSKDAAKEFAEKIAEMAKGLPDVSQNQMVRAIGLDSDGMNSALTVVSLSLMQKNLEGASSFEDQSHLFTLGVTIGRLYGRQEMSEGADIT